MKFIFMQIIKAVDKDGNSHEITPVTVVAEGTPREFLCEGKLMEAYKALNRKRNLAERELREKFGSDYEVVVQTDRTDGVDRAYRLNGRSYTRHELIEFILYCLTQSNQLQELFGGALLEEMQNQVNSAIAEFELQGVTYGVYNGGTPIFTGIESYGKAQAVFYNTAKACKILGLRCDLVNEATGEVIE